MAVSIIYVETFPGPASADGDGASLALFADNGTNQHQTILATVGGLMTVHIIATGAGLTSGQYNNIPIITTSNNTAGQGATVNVNVNAAGYILSTAVQVVIPGYGYTLGSFGVSLATIGTAGSTLATWAITAMLPCTAPFPAGTQFVEMAVDANGPANITIDSTMTSMGLTNSLLSTQQSTLTTTACRMAANERLVRRITQIVAPVQGASGAGFALPISVQVIMGTAAA